MRTLSYDEVNLVSGAASGDNSNITVWGHYDGGPSLTFEIWGCTQTVAGIAAAATYAVTKNAKTSLIVDTITYQAAQTPCMAAVAEVNHILHYTPVNSMTAEIDYMHSLGYGKGSKLMP